MTPELVCGIAAYGTCEWTIRRTDRDAWLFAQYLGTLSLARVLTLIPGEFVHKFVQFV